MIKQSFSKPETLVYVTNVAILTSLLPIPHKLSFGSRCPGLPYLPVSLWSSKPGITGSFLKITAENLLPTLAPLLPETWT